MKKKSLFERFSDWFEDAKDWQRFCTIAAFIALLILAIILMTIMPIVWAIRSRSIALLLLWIIPLSIGIAIIIMTD